MCVSSYCRGMTGCVRMTGCGRTTCTVRVTRNKRESSSSSYSATWNGQHIVGRVRTQGDESSGIGDCADLVYQLQVREAIHVHLSAQHYHYSVPPKLHSEYWVAVCGVQGGDVGSEGCGV